MNARDDGGPAFPYAEITTDDLGTVQVLQEGMTLRDYFAAKPPEPPQWWTRDEESMKSLDEVAKYRAQWAYVYADAMLAARST